MDINTQKSRLRGFIYLGSGHRGGHGQMRTDRWRKYLLDPTGPATISPSSLPLPEGMRCWVLQSVTKLVFVPCSFVLHLKYHCHMLRKLPPPALHTPIVSRHTVKHWLNFLFHFQAHINTRYRFHTHSTRLSMGGTGEGVESVGAGVLCPVFLLLRTVVSPLKTQPNRWNRGWIPHV